MLANSITKRRSKKKTQLGKHLHMKSTYQTFQTNNDTLTLNIYTKPNATLHYHAGFPFIMFRVLKNHHFIYIVMDTENPWHLRLYNKTHKDNKIKHNLQEITTHVFGESHDKIDIIGSIFRSRIPILNEDEGHLFENGAPFLFQNVYLNCDF